VGGNKFGRKIVEPRKGGKCVTGKMESQGVRLEWARGPFAEKTLDQGEGSAGKIANRLGGGGREKLSFRCPGCQPLVEVLEMGFHGEYMPPLN